MPSLGYRRSPAARGSETSSRRPSFQIRDPLSAHGKVRATAVLPPTVGSCTPRLACPPTRCAKTARFFCRGRNERHLPSAKCSGPVANSAKPESAQTRSPSRTDRKSTRLNSSHDQISYAVFCLKKKKKKYNNITHKHSRIIC